MVGVKIIQLSNWASMIGESFKIVGAIDKYIVDGVVNLAGWSGRFGAYLTGIFDSRVVDGAVNGAANAAASGGQLLRGTQTGRVRAYVLFLFVSATVVTLAVITVTLAAR